jgi:eukaryotic-like serine/threonine-protein kinase
MATSGPRDQLIDAVAGRYAVGRELGRGGMSVVFEATDLRDQQPVALKVLAPEIALAVGPARFQREIQFLRQLRHPNIVPVLDASEVGPLLFFTMPQIPGENLRALIGRVGPLTLDRTLAIARDVAAALDFAHRWNILHRDIKPENILLDGDHALVCDFGVARAIERAGERISSSGLLLGTPGYMSPEQAQGREDLDHRCDIYAFGCVVFEMLTGEPAFSGPSAQAIVARQAAGESRSLRTVRPDLPESVDTAIRHAMARAREARPETASAVVTGLQG